MTDVSTDVMSDSDDPDILYRYEQKLRADEQIAELEQQVAERDHEIKDLKSQFDCTTDECKQSLQRLAEAENQVHVVKQRSKVK